MFDTHCHLNFSRFKNNLEQVISDAHQAGVSHILIPGTDIATSQQAIAIANFQENMFVAVGIHPHHVFEFHAENPQLQFEEQVLEIENMLSHPKVVAVGEIGMDRHEYKATKYKEYTVTNEFLESQKLLLEEQMHFAIEHKKSLILHNREAKGDLLPIVDELWDNGLERRAVFHCCEPDEQILEFAKKHKMFVGVDGDITYSPEKQKFIAKIPLEMLVVETDAPFLLPEPLREQKKFPNEPKNIPLIVDFIAKILKVETGDLAKQTLENGLELFNLR